MSAIYKYPALSYAIPWGLLNVATFPLPSANPDDIALSTPARVLTIPVEMTILRILSLPVSATYKFPELSHAIPYG